MNGISLSMIKIKTKKLFTKMIIKIKIKLQKTLINKVNIQIVSTLNIIKYYLSFIESNTKSVA
jgi:hypothetical protein